MIACGDVILFYKITGRPQGSPLRAQLYQPDKLKFEQMPQDGDAADAKQP